MSLGPAGWVPMTMAQLLLWCRVCGSLACSGGVPSFGEATNLFGTDWGLASPLDCTVHAVDLPYVFFRVANSQTPSESNPRS